MDTLAPLIVLVVTAVFAVLVIRQYLSRRKPYQLVWSIALTLAAVAALAFIRCIDAGHAAFWFELYYFLGALLTAALLGLGSIYLVWGARAGHVTAVIVAIVSIVGAVLLAATPLYQDQLSALPNLITASGTVQLGADTAGTSVLHTGIWLLPLIVLNTFGAVAVIAAALYSAWLLYRKHVVSRFLYANMLIAGGTFIVALAGSMARLGNGAPFWYTMAIGWVVLFGGFALTQRIPSMAPKPAPARELPAS